MTVYEAIEQRRSIRQFKPDDVPETVLLRILNAARLAPSGCAREARKFIVVRDKEKKEKINRAQSCWWPGPERSWNDGNAQLENAPVVIVACNVVPEANMIYFGSENDMPVMFTNMTRKPDEPPYWDEYIQHRQSHNGEYASLGVWDVAIALDHLSLAAVGEGLGTCWKAVTDEAKLREVLSIPPNVQARMIMALGYPDTTPESAPRKPLEEVICFEGFS